MFGKKLAVLAAIGAALATTASGAAFGDGMPAAKKAIKYSPRVHVAYHYVRGPWPGGPDPFAYSYGRPGYYPYYNSNYWAPRRQMLGRSKYPMRIPEYYSSWGYPLACKVHGRRHCGVPYPIKPGEPRHYYDRAAQLPAHR